MVRSDNYICVCVVFALFNSRILIQLTYRSQQLETWIRRSQKEDIKKGDIALGIVEGLMVTEKIGISRLNQKKQGTKKLANSCGGNKMKMKGKHKCHVSLCIIK